MLQDLDAQQAATEQLAPQFIGLTVYEARQLANELGQALRVLDGPVTMDFRPSRLNLTVEDGVVVGTSVG